VIAYKWVIKKDNKYYSLMSFGIDSWIKNRPIIKYKIGQVYKNCKDLDSRRNLYYRGRFEHKPYYHFWKQPIIQPEWDRYNKYLSLYKHLKINAILKCEVNEFIDFNNDRLITRQFKVLEEIPIKLTRRIV